MKVRAYKVLEGLILFVVIPLSFMINYSIWLKLGLGVIGFLYVVYVLTVVEKLPLNISKHLNWHLFLKQTLIKFLLIALLTTFFIWFTNKELLFFVVLNKPKLWLMILFIYTVFSVYPQEILYRTFFFYRYETLVKSKIGFVLLNAALFTLGHLFFKNNLVLVLTFIGGLLFAGTYQKTRSTLLVSIEHTIYGCWLFTVGMGNILGFPS
ncbi:CPBP family intramembrane metalloprotease [Tamlana fucoidanivorans]|uniref:CPBP family intramembrane metalloprotease n=1 Tax=Allotamlana fucoidanivorans TaxID=2583814 RepID=A0A5C4SQN9_9FLAO|nr:CPBP family intramembrane glutamic endopeptidase [Tamlana fucoidanivorans]TNJ46514.1 CPBP family intramembrane metalloprotease [Tamlana fucoidanivorans]